MKRIYFLAGEPSGDFLGATVIDRLSKYKDVKICGLGGSMMKRHLTGTINAMQQIAVGGIAEIIPQIFMIKRLIHQVAEDIIQQNPDVLLTIDSPGFCFRVAKLVKKQNSAIKLLHLVAPSVWAWRSNRARKLAKIYDHLLTLFDFEPPYFTKYGLKTTFVGHPATEEFNDTDNRKENMLLVLPGSRKQEITMLLPIFIETLKYLSFERVVIPTLPHLEPLIKSLILQNNIEIVSDETKKKLLFQTAKCSIVASGTATLQLALSGCPMVCCYKLAPLTYHIIKSMINIQYISLVNILLKAPVVPELIQSDCVPEKIAQTVKTLQKEEQVARFPKLYQHILANNNSPSAKIADIILQT